jgi:phosphoribosylamine--glycine ligase
MNILLLGSGGREHALAWKMSQSNECSKLYIAPGNPGTAQSGENLPVQAMDFEGIRDVLIEKNINLLVVGPDDPLGFGIVDYLERQPSLKELAILGPKSNGAKLEASKSFAKEFMFKHGIPTAQYRSFTKEDRNHAEEYILRHSLPVVMKADGLAAGKGVSICNTAAEALKFISDTWDHDKFGESGGRIVVEEFLKGIELSVFIVTDGLEYVLLPDAKDYKRIGENDEGENTGGMGAVSPVPFADEAFKSKIVTRIIEPTIQGLQKDNIHYRGFIFFGLIKVGNDPYVIEYNARMGDPETQVVMPRIKSDIVPVFYRAARKELKDEKIDISDDYATAVIAVSGGYPGSFEKGKEISGLGKVDDALIFQAGVKESGDGLVTSGGRVCAVVGMDSTMEGALEKAYEGISQIEFEKMYFRKDIGRDLQKLAQNQEI